MHVCMCACACTCMNTYIYICIYIYVYIYICIWMCWGIIIPGKLWVAKHIQTHQMTMIFSVEQSPNRLTHVRPNNTLTKQHFWLNMKLAGGMIPAIHHFSFIVLSYLGRDHPIFRHGEMDKMIETTSQGLSESLFGGMGAKGWRYHVFSSKLISRVFGHISQTLRKVPFDPCSIQTATRIQTKMRCYTAIIVQHQNCKVWGTYQISGQIVLLLITPMIPINNIPIYTVGKQKTNIYIYVFKKKVNNEIYVNIHIYIYT